MHNEIKALIEKIDSGGESFTTFVGFDGFVDTIVYPVKKEMKDSKEYFRTIKEFGEHFIKKDGRSSSIDIEKKETKFGGNAPIYARALASLGSKVICAGSLGYPKPLEIFEDLNICSQVISVGESGECTALEFEDGKILLSQSTCINRLDYRTLVERVGFDRMKSMIQEADLVSLVNWSELMSCTDIWYGLQENIFVDIDYKKGKQMLIDLSDCSRRSDEDILEMLELLSRFANHFRIILSLNLNEAEVLSSLLGCSSSNVEKTAKCLFNKIGVNTVIIHSKSFACLKNEDEEIMIHNEIVENPVISTGAGDHFNAGLSFALGGNISWREVLIIASAVSRSYVKEGMSPNKEKLYSCL